MHWTNLCSTEELNVNFTGYMNMIRKDILRHLTKQSAGQHTTQEILRIHKVRAVLPERQCCRFSKRRHIQQR